MKLLFRALRGSQAYGTATKESDNDYVGLYQQSHRELLGFGYKQQIDINKDEVHYEIKRFLELAETANPMILETLYLPTDCIEIQDPILNTLFENRDKFLTKKCKNSFVGYVISQLKKARGLNKKANWEADKVEVRKLPIDFCYVVLDGTNRIENIKQGVYPLKDWLTKMDMEEKHVSLNKLNHTREGYQLYYNVLEETRGICAEDSTKLRTNSTPVDLEPYATVLYNADSYTQHCKEFESYQKWLTERNENRYVNQKNHEQVYDSKNMMHVRRLLDVAEEIATGQGLNVKRPNREYLLSIRCGEVNLEDILAKAEDDIIRVQELFDTSDLPDDVDKNLVEEILLKIRGV
jgi:uncharacterized protein